MASQHLSSIVCLSARLCVRSINGDGDGKREKIESDSSKVGAEAKQKKKPDN